VALEIREPDGRRRVQRTVTVLRSPSDCYSAWRDFARLPSFMDSLESVTVDPTSGRSHWKVKAPAGQSVEWDAEVVEDVPGSFLSWRSLPGADPANSGEVVIREAPGGRGTEVTVALSYDPPLGEVGRIAAKLLGEEPAMQLDEDIVRFKEMMETGRIPTTAGQPNGRNRPSVAKRGAA